MEESHPVQIAFMVAFAVLDVVGLITINGIKQADPKGKPPNFSWEVRRNSMWACMAVTISLAVGLDLYFPLEAGYLGSIKGYLFGFPLGLLDLYFSSTTGVSYQVLVGAALWCSCALLRQLALDTFVESDYTKIVVMQELSMTALSSELMRYLAALVGIGLASDFFFSPFHRLMHHPKLYQRNHKEHHIFTNDLTSLVIYHGTLLDDFLMPFTTTLGGFIYIYMCSQWQLHAFSNVVGYVLMQNTLLSHAHDIRCARLAAPLPDSLNFVAYHFCHHLSPCNNYGLMEPTDRLWDWILRVKTIVSYDSLVQSQTEGKRA